MLIQPAVYFVPCENGEGLSKHGHIKNSDRGVSPPLFSIEAVRKWIEVLRIYDHVISPEEERLMLDEARRHGLRASGTLKDALINTATAIRSRLSLMDNEDCDPNEWLWIKTAEEEDWANDDNEAAWRAPVASA